MATGTRKADKHRAELLKHGWTGLRRLGLHTGKAHFVSYSELSAGRPPCRMSTSTSRRPILMLSLIESMLAFAIKNEIKKREEKKQLSRYAAYPKCGDEVRLVVQQN